MYALRSLGRSNRFLQMKVLNALDMANHLRKLGSKPGQLLGLNVSSVFIGSAISDHSLETAEPLRIFHKNKTDVDKELKKVIDEFKLSGFIIGLPTYRMRKTAASEMVERFVDSLSKTGAFPEFKVCYWDACCTSENASLMLDQVKDLTPYQRRDLGAKFAAVGILQGYLDYFNDPNAKPWRGVL